MGIRFCAHRYLWCTIALTFPNINSVVHELCVLPSKEVGDPQPALMGLLIAGTRCDSSNKPGVLLLGREKSRQDT